jgi:uncharacterized membrane protein YedE/YeeE
MMEALMKPWPWYIAGPLIGLFVPLLLVLGNKQFGVSGSLRAVCAALLPSKVEFFNFDWKRTGAWNIAFVAGIVLGGAFAVQVLGSQTPDIATATSDAISSLGLGAANGLMPSEVFSWSALFTLRGFVSMVFGGFLIGFGTAYAGGCTSGHGVAGLAAFQLPSLIAVIAFFAGGVFSTFVLFPLVFQA